MALAEFSNTDYEHLIDASPFKPPLKVPKQPTFKYVFPSIETYSALCFCCFATDVPLMNAAKCRHKDFVNVYLLMAPSVPLLICNICHHMLKKIDGFRMQIQSNFTNLVSKKEPDETVKVVNNLNKTTIVVVSLKPMTITNTESQDIDPLSESTVPSEVATHGSFVDDVMKAPEETSDMLTLKTEPEEAPNTALSYTNTKDTNIPLGTTQYYVESTPNSIKQEILPPMPPLTFKGSLIHQKKLDQPIITINNGLIQLNPLKNNNKEIKTKQNPLNNPQSISLTRPETTEKIVEENANNHAVDLETLIDSINKPWNPQTKCQTKQTIEENSNNVNKKVTKEDDLKKSSNTETRTYTDIGKLLKNYDYRVLDWKQRNKGPNYSDTLVDESYKDKIGMIILTEAEIIKERDSERLEESFAKNAHKCESCIEAFQYDFVLDRHNERFHCKKNNDVECPICKRRYLSERNMEEHSIKHFVRYLCLVCNLRSKTLPSLTKHFNKTHTDKEPILKKYECDDCDFVSYYRGTYNHHRNNNHKMFMCKVCNKKLTGSASFRYHMKYCHDDVKATKKKALYNCDECTASFASCGHYTYHKKTLHSPAGKPTPVFCQPCNKFFINKIIYKNHMKNSTAHSNGILKFECDHCHKKYPHKPTLVVHIQRHHLKSLNFKCKVCSKLFSVNRDLNKHIRQVHFNKTRPREVCDVCGKDYVSKAVLRKHQLVHTGERPHACDLCGMTFVQSSTLATHKKLKHKIPKKMEIVKENSASVS